MTGWVPLCLDPPLGPGLLALGLYLSGRRGGTLLSPLIDDLVLFHLAVQRRTIQAEDLCGFLLVPVRPLKRLQDRHLLDLGKRAVRRNRELLRWRSLLANLLGQVVGENFTCLTYQHSAFNCV